MDGDTIDVSIDLGFKISTRQRLRLARVDTPERGQDKFVEAKKFVENLVLGQKVTIRTEKVSKWGYYLAEVITEKNENVSDVLIANDLGKFYYGGTK